MRKKMETTQANEDKMLSQKIVLFLPKRHFIQISWLKQITNLEKRHKIEKKKKEKKQRSIKVNHESVMAERKTRKKKNVDLELPENKNDKMAVLSPHLSIFTINKSGLNSIKRCSLVG